MCCHASFWQVQASAPIAHEVRVSYRSRCLRSCEPESRAFASASNTFHSGLQVFQPAIFFLQRLQRFCCGVLLFCLELNFRERLQRLRICRINQTFDQTLLPFQIRDKFFNWYLVLKKIKTLSTFYSSSINETRTKKTPFHMVIGFLSTCYSGNHHAVYL